jgi:hypothetical protein
MGPEKWPAGPRVQYLTSGILVKDTEFTIWDEKHPLGT